MNSPGNSQGPCWKCSRFGGWMPVRMGDRIRYNVVGWCAKARQVEVTPANGCPHWLLQVPTRTEPLIGTSSAVFG